MNKLLFLKTFVTAESVDESTTHEVDKSEKRLKNHLYKV